MSNKKSWIVLMTVGGVLLVSPSFAETGIAAKTYVDTAVSGKISKIAGATGGKLATTVSDGQVAEGSLAAADLVTTSTIASDVNDVIANNTTIQETIATVIQADLAGKADLMPGTAGYVATIDADGQYDRSGLTVTTVNNKADQVSGATANNFAGLNSSGNLIDSGKSAADFATTGALTELLYDKADKIAESTPGNLVAQDVGGNIVDSGFAPSDFIPKIAEASANRLISVDESGNLQDSGFFASDFATASALGTLTTTVGNKENSSNKTTNMTSANQGSTTMFPTISAVETYVGTVALPVPPTACADSTNYCVLTSDGTDVMWEVIVR